MKRFDSSLYSPRFYPVREDGEYSSIFIGYCDADCPSFDGRGCKLTSSVPCGICEPWAYNVLEEYERVKDLIVALKEDVDKLSDFVM